MTESYLEYPARLNISYQDAQNRWSILLRLVIFLPLIPVVLTVLDFILDIVGQPYSKTVMVAVASVFTVLNFILDIAWYIMLIAGILAALFIIFSATYPRWLFEFHGKLLQLEYGILAYILLLTDEFPSIHGSEKFRIELTYPNAETDLNRLLPLIKWLLVFPHGILFFLYGFLLVIMTPLSWLYMSVSGRYPERWFDLSVSILRWWLRVQAYSLSLITDQYPSLSLSE